MSPWNSRLLPRWYTAIVCHGTVAQCLCLIGQYGWILCFAGMYPIRSSPSSTARE
jgi:hypothetical protein